MTGIMTGVINNDPPSDFFVDDMYDMYGATSRVGWCGRRWRGEGEGKGGKDEDPQEAA
jgi:hypothetical protein